MPYVIDISLSSIKLSDEKGSENIGIDTCIYTVVWQGPLIDFWGVFSVRLSFTYNFD